ncbi:hypothetical protein V496_03393 [Pseudogymnoascus sp. VKM F-4515 (FW-2607)]|nr:hypothetical protein V496_03393 [Pseudogymnoascus sp. VKM F-4515 (FW-2607)]KFY83420.1 hypothetical protein V498_08090 [Pseudogymnoascus sp. VKM F-4517 (FW-2822)]
MSALRRIFSFSPDLFDSSHRFETSWLITPWALFFFRAFFSFYTFFVLIFNLIWTGVQPSYGGGPAASLSFSYFTILTYWGLAFYFLFSSIHTLTYARHGTPLLARFPRPLQALHSLLYTTILTYPLLVTIVYWAILYTAWFPTPYPRWTNLSQHAFNSLFALFELVIPRTNRPPWIHLPALILILALYLALAYLTHYTRGVYVYDFLDPGNGRGALTGYVLGIAAGIVVIFLVVQGLVWLRKWATEKKLGREGRFHGGRAKAQGDAELEATRQWEDKP